MSADSSPIWAMIVSLLVLIFVIVVLIHPFKIHLRFRRTITLKFDFSIAPIIGVFVLLITNAMTPLDAWQGFVGDQNLQPYAIIILFFSLAYVCVSLDMTGIFDFLAIKTVKATKGKGHKLFFSFFLLSAALSVLTSNDIVVLTLTPIICALASYAKIDPTAILFAQFFGAHLSSVMLFTSNPTNIIVAEAYGLSFLGYSKWMALVGVVAGAVCYGLLWFFFREKIPDNFPLPDLSTKGIIKDKFGMIYGSIVLFATLILLTVGTWTKLPIWLVTLGAATLSLTRDIIYDIVVYCRRRRRRKQHRTKQKEEENVLEHQLSHSDLESGEHYTLNKSHSDNVQNETTTPPYDATENKDQNKKEKITNEANQKESEHLISATRRTQKQKVVTLSVLKRLPWKIVPFVIGVFIIVQALYVAGWTKLAAEALLAAITPADTTTTVLVAVVLVGVTSSLACNILNNQPMTILYTKILLEPTFQSQVSNRIQLSTMLALVLGANLGANLTLIGALAGIMWTTILRNKGYFLSFAKFARWGFTITPLVILSCCAFLALELMIFPLN